MLRFVLGVKMIKIAEKFIEAMHRRQMLVAVAEIVLAELAAGIALRLEQFGKRRVLFGQAFLRAWHAHFKQAGAEA